MKHLSFCTFDVEVHRTFSFGGLQIHKKQTTRSKPSEILNLKLLKDVTFIITSKKYLIQNKTTKIIVFLF